jgi:hypothetical protein
MNMISNSNNKREREEVNLKKEAPTKKSRTDSEDVNKTGMTKAHTRIMKEFSNENDVIIV